MAKLITKNEQSISWKELAEGVKAGEIALQQGDTVELKLTTGEIVFMQAVKVSEDGKRVTFVSKDCLATEMPMNEERTNYGGWAESDLRKRLNNSCHGGWRSDNKVSRRTVCRVRTACRRRGNAFQGFRRTSRRICKQCI